MQKRRVHRHEVIQPLDDSYRLIPLTQDQNAIVDAADFEFLNQWNWYAHWNKFTKTFYPTRSVGRNTVTMHWEIFDCQCDHANKNTLDNRRKNLRKCTVSENSYNRKKRCNSDGYVGVSWRPKERKWVARITVNKKVIYLGYFKKAKDAAMARDRAALIHHKEFAHLNSYE